MGKMTELSDEKLLVEFAYDACSLIYWGHSITEGRCGELRKEILRRMGTKEVRRVK